MSCVGWVFNRSLPSHPIITPRICCFPSTSDTQAIVLYEALAAGLPIVAVDSMAAREASEAEKMD